VETHLADTNSINVYGYNCISKVRKKHVRARKCSGGVALLYKRDLLQYFRFSEICSDVDGILAVNLMSMYSSFQIVIIVVYLPPEQSPWGRDSARYFNELTRLSHEFCNADLLVLLGDFNAKIGEEHDFIAGVDDDIGMRNIISKDKNNHGTSLIEFLIDNRLCVLNGRITPHCNNYTFVHSRGKSVIDYIIIPQQDLDKCSEMNVFLARDMINLHCYDIMSNLDLSKQTPDHSILHAKMYISDLTRLKNTTSIRTSEYHNKHAEHGHALMHNCNNEVNSLPPEHIYYERFRIQDVGNSSAFTNEDFAKKRLDFLQNASNTTNTQYDIDLLYNNFCDLYHNEAKNHFKTVNVHPKNRKSRRYTQKPYWSDDIKVLWASVAEREKEFLSSSGHARSLKKQAYKNAQNDFERQYRKCRKNYEYQQRQKLALSRTDNPKEFWKMLKNLGPNKRSQDNIVLEVYLENGEVTQNLNVVMEKWVLEYSELYKSSQAIDRGREVIMPTPHVMVLNDSPRLNVPFSYLEIQKVVSQSKIKKAVGLDNLPNELVKNENSIPILSCIFNKIFENSILPSTWRQAIIKPLPKSSMSDPRMPLQYRGISLLSTVYKLFTSCLNNRIKEFCEEHALFVEEQNGFRSARSCLEHLFSLTTVLRNRQIMKKETFVAFIDFEKAFDRVPHDLLINKLHALGFRNNMYDILRSIYTAGQACITLNGYITGTFNVDIGIRQGDSLSPTLFALYINDLGHELLNSGNGIALDPLTNISCLLYADDLVIASDTEEKLQAQIQILQLWCVKWEMKVNIKKTEIVHFRGKNKARTMFKFQMNDNIIDIVTSYRYLGLQLDEHLTFHEAINTLSCSGGRALGAIISKFQTMKGMDFYSYSQLFISCVASVLDYASPVWGHKNVDKIDTIQNRALRFFLGVSAYAPNLGVQGDTGWLCGNGRRNLELLRLWNQLVTMRDDRLPKNIFLWDKHVNYVNGWSNSVRRLLSDIGCSDNFERNVPIDLNFAGEKIYRDEQIKWKQRVVLVPKLRTYHIFKPCYEAEPYLYLVQNRAHRSVISQLRLGILPLKIETGRYTNIPLEYRLCIFCDDNAIEDEQHFIFNCSKYEDLRLAFYNDIGLTYFDAKYILEEPVMLQRFMSQDIIKIFSRFVYQCYNRRQDCMYL